MTGNYSAKHQWVVTWLLEMACGAAPPQNCLNARWCSVAEEGCCFLIGRRYLSL